MNKNINLKSIDVDNKGTFIEFCTHELTFLGMSGQPYRGTLYIQYITNNKVLDLLSLKKYIESLKMETIILEDIAKVVYDSINSVLECTELCVTANTTPRGGISSTIRYGYDKFNKPEMKPIVFGN